MKAMRDWGREVKGIRTPVVVACYTVHAAFDKFAHYLGMKLRKVGLTICSLVPLLLIIKEVWSQWELSPHPFDNQPDACISSG